MKLLRYGLVLSSMMALSCIAAHAEILSRHKRRISDCSSQPNSKKKKNWPADAPVSDACGQSDEDLPSNYDKIPKMVLDKIVCHIDQDIVTLSDLEKFKKNIGIRTQLDPLFKIRLPQPEAATLSHQQALNFLIDDKIIKKNFPISEGELASEIASNQNALQLSDAQFKLSLERAGITIEHYKDHLSTAKSWQYLVRKELSQKIIISEEKLKNYYEQKAHHHKLTSEKEYHLKFITILENAYTEKKFAMDQAIKAQNELKTSSVSFDAVIAHYHEDDTTIKDSKILKVLASDLTAEILHPIQKIAKGQHTPIIKTPGKLHIIQLVDIKDSNENEYAKIKEALREELFNILLTESVTQWLQMQRKKLYISILL